MKSAGGATLTRLADDSILAGGVNPPSDQYTVVFAVPEKMEIRSIRLEALSHDSLPGKDRAARKEYAGVFALDRWDLTAKRPGRAGSSRPLSFRAAAADYSWNDAPLGLSGEWNISLAARGSITLRSGAWRHRSHWKPAANWFPTCASTGLPIGRIRISADFGFRFAPDLRTSSRRRSASPRRGSTDPWAKAGRGVSHDRRPAGTRQAAQASPGSGCQYVGDLYAASQDWERAIAEYRKLVTDRPADVVLLSQTRHRLPVGRPHARGGPVSGEGVRRQSDGHDALPEGRRPPGVVRAGKGTRRHAAADPRVRQGTTEAMTAERAAKACSILPSTDKAELEAALALGSHGGKAR